MRVSFGRKDGPSLLSHGLLLGLFLHSIPAEARGPWRYDYSLGTDYRRARMDWNIAGSLVGTGPNVLSELSWKDLDIAQISGAAQVTVSDRLVLLGRIAYGMVVNGRVRDSDYNGDNRTLEYLRSDSKGDGNIGDGSIGFGYRFRLFAAVKPAVYLAPMAGYSLHLQYLKISDGRQIIPATGAIDNLDSNYNAEWSGPWLGMNVRLEADERTAVIVNAEYHRAYYYAEANWNLRDDLAHPVSFKHDARGFGFILSMAVSRVVTKHLDVLARMEAQNWETNAGVDTLYTINTTTKELQPTVTRLNAVHWRSLSGGIAATYHF
jgi:hypothetical protein